jgi:di/tricarboxylate transporter
MSTDAALVLALLVATFGALVTQWVRIEIVGLAIIVVLGLSGVLDASDALRGFSSPATLTVMAMLILSAGLQKAGVVDYVSARLTRVAGSGDRHLLLVLMIPTAAFSAFMNNTPIVALMIPVALTLGRHFDKAPSKLLIPLSYAAIVGGTCTLIGTSTNILVHSLYRDAGGPGFSMFEFGKLGLLYMGIAFAYIIVVGPRILPKRAVLNEMLSASAPGHFVTEVVLRAPNRLIGKSLGAAFDEASEVSVLELVRNEEALLRPDPSVVLADGDLLLVEANARAIHSLLSTKGVEQGTAVADDERVRISRVDLRVAEAVVTPRSSFIRSKVKDLELTRKHGVQVLAIRRMGQHHQYQLRQWLLRAGDVLLVQGETEALRLLQEDGDVLLIEGVEAELTMPRKAPIALAILVAVVLTASLDLVPIVFSALAGVALMLATRVLQIRETVRAADPTVLLLLAGTIPLGRAMETTGLAASAAHWVAQTAGPYGPWVVIGMFYVLTSLLTEIVSNNATAVLLTPVALGLAASLGMDPKPLLVAVAFGASASFATPIGYQTNTLVMGTGGYFFRDFLRIGLPLNIIMAIAATILIPLIWPP